MSNGRGTIKWWHVPFIQGEIMNTQENKFDNLIQAMTLEEKVSLLAGASFWYTVPIERLGIPAIKVTDGPNGARGDGLFATGVPAACFPVGIALAATWNTELIEQIGVALAEECKSKGAHVLLAPTVNIHRSPVNGRNFECYSEDPYLSAELATAYVKGVQSQRVSATIKHFVCNDSEFERNTISSEVGERALREIYLPPFKAAVEKAGVWALMSSYNYVNGVHASSNPYTLTDILRDEWDFDGVVMSDWFGTRTTVEAANAGLDLEMPGPARQRGDKLLQAVKNGEVSEETINLRVRNMLRLIERVGAFENPQIPAEQAIDRPEHRALIRRAGAEAAVLLKNNGVLPLDVSRVSQLAIIGPNAKTARAMGGGSAQLKSHPIVTPYEGIVNRVGESIELGYEIGCTNHRNLPAMESSWFEGQSVEVQYFNSLDLSGDAVAKDRSSSLEFMWFGSLPTGVKPGSFSARVTGKFRVPEDGDYILAVSCSGKARLYVDGREIADNWTAPAPGMFMMQAGSGEARGTTALKAGQSYEFQLDYTTEGAQMLNGARVGCMQPIPADSVRRAAKLAAESDVALVFVGLNHEWESEGFDRPDMELVGEQVALIEQVAAANPNTVVVLQTGSPVRMPWLDKVAAVVQAWYPGEEVGNAIADVLFGVVPPSGRLPQTFPVRIEDNPAYINYPGENGKVHYGEGIFVGYRYYDKKKVEPLFPFGFGLSYTTFAYTNLRLSAAQIKPDEMLKVMVDVTNTGKREGQEVVQVYVRDERSALMRPEKELKAFAKVNLKPGETQTVTLTLNRESLAYYDDLKGAWVAEAGEFVVLVGASSRDIRAQAAFTLTETAQFGGRKQAAIPKLSLDTPLGTLLKYDAAKDVLNRVLPGMLDNPQLEMAMGMTINQVAGFAPDAFTDEVMKAIAEGLAAIHNGK